MSVVWNNPKVAPQKIVELDNDARKIIEEKIHGLMKANAVDILVAASPADFAYISGVFLPYAEQYTLPRAAAVMSSDIRVICPPDWASIPQDQGREVKTEVYSAKEGMFYDVLVKHIAAAVGSSKKIGLDKGELSVLFVRKLEEALPGVEIIDLSCELRKLRMIKTEAEIVMLERAIRFNDRAAIAALNHSEGCVIDDLGFYTWEFAERLRVHIGEFGGSGCGNVTALVGEDMRFIWKNPSGKVVPGNPMRFETTGHHLGYWGSSARTVYIGQPSPEFEAAYAENLRLKQETVKMLKPGAVASQIFRGICEMALTENIDIFTAAGVGYGVGLSEREAPYLCATDDTVLETGMVIVVAVYTYGPERELICSKDTYEITAEGARLMSWYKNYDKIYRMNGTTARHG